MRINAIFKSEKYDEHRDFKDQNENTRRNQNENNKSISFSEVLKRAKQDTYLK